LVQDKDIECIGFEGFNQVRIERSIEYILSMCKRGPIQSYLGHEVRTAKETKESYYNLDTIWVALSE
jgi:hypothetical protein